MTSLFSSFDMTYFFNSFLTFFLLSSTLMNLIFFTSVFNFSSMSLFSGLEKFYLSLNPKSWGKNFLSNILGLMFFIMVLNFFSVFPFVFPFTSQFGPIFLVSLSLWLSFIFFSISSSTKNFFSHCIPEGTPLGLVPFLFLIEVMSNFIRPLTLSIRLVANILSGHLLMILLSANVFYFAPSFIFYMVLTFIEIFVSLIQAYIFCTMSSLYFSDVK